MPAGPAGDGELRDFFHPPLRLQSAVPPLSVSQSVRTLQSPELLLHPLSLWTGASTNSAHEQTFFFFFRDGKSEGRASHRARGAAFRTPSTAEPRAARRAAGCLRSLR